MSSDVTIRPLDPTSLDDVELYRRFTERYQHDVFGAVGVRTLPQQQVQMQSTPYWEVDIHAALLRDGTAQVEMVGELALRVPLRENLDMVDLALVVLRAHRGRGIGTRLADLAQQACAATGRPRCTTYAEVDAECDISDSTLPEHRIATRLGLTRRNVAVSRLLDLPVPEKAVHALEEEASSRAGGYRIETFRGAIPQQHWLRYGELLTQLDLDEPDEDVEYEPQVYDLERLKVMFERQERSGVESLMAVAIAPDGTWVGNTVIDYRRCEGTTLAVQENTLVMPEHRGHRLGWAMKAANHRQLARVAPHLRVVATWNSHVNDQMIAINERLGYRVAGYTIAFQN